MLDCVSPRIAVLLVEDELLPPAAGPVGQLLELETQPEGAMQDVDVIDEQVVEVTPPTLYPHQLQPELAVHEAQLFALMQLNALATTLKTETNRTTTTTMAMMSKTINTILAMA